MSGMMEVCAEAIHDAQQAAMQDANDHEAPLNMRDLDFIAVRAALTAAKQIADQLGNEAASLFLDAILSDDPLPPPPEEG